MAFSNLMIFVALLRNLYILDTSDCAGMSVYRERTPRMAWLWDEVV